MKLFAFVPCAHTINNYYCWLIIIHKLFFLLIDSKCIQVILDASFGIRRQFHGNIASMKWNGGGKWSTTFLSNQFNGSPPLCKFVIEYADNNNCVMEWSIIWNAHSVCWLVRVLDASTTAYVCSMQLPSMQQFYNRKVKSSCRRKKHVTQANFFSFGINSAWSRSFCSSTTLVAATVSDIVKKKADCIFSVQLFDSANRSGVNSETMQPLPPPPPPPSSSCTLFSISIYIATNWLCVPSFLCRTITLHTLLLCACIEWLLVLIFTQIFSPQAATLNCCHILRCVFSSRVPWLCCVCVLFFSLFFLE